MKNNKKGFTLVELLVVIAILAILSSVAVVGYTAFVKKAEKSNAETELYQIVTYVNNELADDGKWEFTVDTTTYKVVDNNGTLTVTGASTLADVIKACPDFANLFAGDDAPTLTNDGKTLTYDGLATATLD